MAWNSATNWQASDKPVLADILNGLGRDIRTWGANVDAGGYGLANAAFLVLNPGTLPSGIRGMVAVDANLNFRVFDGGSWVAATTAVPAGTWYSGSGVPSNSLGSNGDMYFRTNGDVYGPKSLGSWGSSIGSVAGAPGAQGPPGAAVNARGAYAAGTTYAQFDGVTYSGSSYISLQAANTGHTPSSSPTWWQLVGSAPVTSGTSILKGDGAGGFGNAAAGTDYQAPLPSGTDGQVLTRDSGQPNLVKWATPSGGGISARTTGGHSLETVYHNTTGKAVFVLVTLLVTSGEAVYQALSDSATTPTIQVAAAKSSVGSLNGRVSLPFWVLPGDYYSVKSMGGAAGVDSWLEWS